VPLIENTVNSIPCLPACKALCTFIPKPKPTTDICNSNCVALWFKCSYGCPVNCATTSPSNNASAGLINGVRHNTKHNININFLVLSLISGNRSLLFFKICWASILFYLMAQISINKKCNFHYNIPSSITLSYWIKPLLKEFRFFKTTPLMVCCNKNSRFLFIVINEPKKNRYGNY